MENLTEIRNIYLLSILMECMIISSFLISSPIGCIISGFAFPHFSPDIPCYISLQTSSLISPSFFTPLPREAPL